MAEPSAAPTLIEKLNALAQEHFDLSNRKGTPQWQNKAHAHAWAGICNAIHVVEAHFAVAPVEASPRQVVPPIRENPK